MKYVIQFLIILWISFLGEVLKYFLPFPIPASIYGLVLLFLCLELGIVKLHHIRETAQFLVDIMPLLFIPAGVGLMESWDLLQPVLIPVLVILVVSTILVMAASGWVTQLLIRRRQQKNAGGIRHDS